MSDAPANKCKINPKLFIVISAMKKLIRVRISDTTGGGHFEKLVSVGFTEMRTSEMRLEG